MHAIHTRFHPYKSIFTVIFKDLILRPICSYIYTSLKLHGALIPILEQIWHHIKTLFRRLLNLTKIPRQSTRFYYVREGISRARAYRMRANTRQAACKRSAI